MRLSIVFLLASGALALTACDTEKAPAPHGGGNMTSEAPAPSAGKGIDRCHAGTPAPDAPFRDPEGEPVTLAAFQGKPVLVNLWATWCAPCVAELPTLDALAAKGRIEVVAISQDMQGREAVDPFFAKRDFKALQPYVDTDAAVMTALGATILPTTILYDSSGKEVWRMTGEEDWASEKAADLIAEAH